jgi:hypothetical protein
LEQAAPILDALSPGPTGGLALELDDGRTQVLPFLFYLERGCRVELTMVKVFTLALGSHVNTWM